MNKIFDFVNLQTNENTFDKTRAIGDIILSTPVIENLRLEYPQAKIDVLVEKFAMPVLESNPFINKILVFDKKLIQVSD